MHQDTTCLRLDDAGAWRSDGIAFVSASGGIAHCSLTTAATSNQVRGRAGLGRCVA